MYLKKFSLHGLHSLHSLQSAVCSLHGLRFVLTEDWAACGRIVRRMSSSEVWLFNRALPLAASWNWGSLPRDEPQKTATAFRGIVTKLKRTAQGEWSLGATIWHRRHFGSGEIRLYQNVRRIWNNLFHHTDFVVIFVVHVFPSYK